ncbi:MAG: flippase [Blastocatellia bacterium]|nr:flippase [Chloracidobacterium sp.]MBL8186195.1 flippase [Blastocatellia bacterium]
MIPEPLEAKADRMPPSTAGMTTKVVKGSLWTLAGQVAPLGVSLVTTPFTIRLLGAEGYGVLILVGLIPTYLGFADFGMSMASTKFGSEAYAEGDEEKEGRIVRTAALIALMTSVPVAALLIFFAGQIIGLFNVPPELSSDAVLALRLASITFVINFLCGIFNTPQLARLRMDLNTFINASSRILGLLATPLVLYLGYGIVGAVTVLLLASLLNLAGHLAVAATLLPGLVRISIEWSALFRVFRFGVGLTGAGIAFLLLSNLDKGVLPAMVSVEQLAYYSVAFTIAGLMTMFSQAMTQSLLPAFSQLSGPHNLAHGRDLFSRALRLNLIVLLPALASLAVIAEPFISFWAGKDFGKESIEPFFILLIGVLFNLPSYLPMCAIISTGRTGLLAKVYLIELIPYVAALVLFTGAWGAKGTAVAWSIRSLLDSIILFVLAKRVTGFSPDFNRISTVALSGLLFSIPVIMVLISGGPTFIVSSSLIVCMLLYSAIVWEKLLAREEIAWLRSRLMFFKAK